MAVAHRILVIAYHLPKDHCVYHELGHDYFDQLRGDGLKHHYIKRLQQLGLEIKTEPASIPA